MNQEQYEAAKATLEAELANTLDEREKTRIEDALATIAKLVVTDASE
jgi:hypothetical protein